jgi:hypothetical protein
VAIDVIDYMKALQHPDGVRWFWNENPTQGGAAAWNQSKLTVSDAMLIGGILCLWCWTREATREKKRGWSIAVNCIAIF